MLTLIRIPKPRQTLGVLRHEPSGWACCTLELPWEENENRRSCILPGPKAAPVTYQAERHDSPRFGETLYVSDVQGRSEILVHAGNYVSDTAGCILVGRRFTDLNGDSLTDVTSSQATLQDLLYRAGDKTDLKISWADTPEPAGLADVAGTGLDALSTEIGPVS